MSEDDSGWTSGFAVIKEIDKQLRERQEHLEPASRVLLSQRAHDAVCDYLRWNPTLPVARVWGLRVVICPDADVYVPSDCLPA